MPVGDVGRERAALVTLVLTSVRPVRRIPNDDVRPPHIPIRSHMGNFSTRPQGIFMTPSFPRESGDAAFFRQLSQVVHD